MKTQIKHYGIVNNGKKSYHNQPLYDNQIQSLEGKSIVEKIQEVHRKPTISQHNYYRGCVLVACYESEMFSHFDKKDDVHDLYFAKKFLTLKKMVEVSGDKYEVTITRSLADLSTDEMREFMNKCIADAQTNGISIPQPQDFYNKFYNK